MRLSALTAFLALSSGCYLAHERDGAAPMDASARDAGPIDAGPTCGFDFTLADGRRAHCNIASGSTEACAEAALCLCGQDGGTSSEVLACAGWNLVPRGALTFTDFCTESPPERMSMTEALGGYLHVESPTSSVDISPACDGVPALLGTRPFGDCGAIASVLCGCDPACDLDAAMGRACLSMPREHVHCIAEHMWESMESCTFFSQLPVLASHCE